MHSNGSEKDHFICHYHVDDGYEIVPSPSSMLSKHSGTDLALNGESVKLVTKGIVNSLFLSIL